MRKFMNQYQNMMEDSLFGPKSAGVIENIFSTLMERDTDNDENDQ